MLHCNYYFFFSWDNVQETEDVFLQDTFTVPFISYSINKQSTDAETCWWRSGTVGLQGRFLWWTGGVFRLKVAGSNPWTDLQNVLQQQWGCPVCLSVKPVITSFHRSIDWEINNKLGSDQCDSSIINSADSTHQSSTTGVFKVRRGYEQK